MSFETADLESLLARITGAGHQVLGGPVEMDSALHGRVQAATVRGPNQVLLEFFSR